MRNRDAVQEDKLDCYCVTYGSYIHAVRLLTKLFYGACKSKQYYCALTRPVLINSISIVLTEAMTQL